MNRFERLFYQLGQESYSWLWQTVDAWDAKAGQMVGFAAVVYGLLRLQEAAWTLFDTLSACGLGAAMLCSLVAWFLSARAKTYAPPMEWTRWHREAIAEGGDPSETQQTAYEAVMVTLNEAYDGMITSAHRKGLLVRISAVLLGVGVILHAVGRFLVGS